MNTKTMTRPAGGTTALRRRYIGAKGKNTELATVPGRFARRVTT